MALSTVSDVEKVLGVDLSTADETNVTNVFITTADAAIENYVGYALGYEASISETFDGDDSEDLFLKRLPIVSVASVVEDGVTLTAGNNNDYVIYNELGLIRRTGLQYWSAQKLRNITVTYTAGYSDSESSAEDIPKDIKFVSARVAGRLFMASAALMASYVWYAAYINFCCEEIIIRPCIFIGLYITLCLLKIVYYVY